MKIGHLLSFRVVATVLAVAAAFGCGFSLGHARATALAWAASIERKAIQVAVTRLNETFPIDAHLADGIDNTQFSALITRALLGRNPQLNPSNLIFVVIDPAREKEGLIVSHTGRPYRFGITAGGNNQKTQILVLDHETPEQRKPGVE